VLSNTSRQSPETLLVIPVGTKSCLHRRRLGKSNGGQGLSRGRGAIEEDFSASFYTINV
jgi:hypothetical protein